MQVTELKSDGLKKSFKVVVDSSKIIAQTEAELKATGERVRIPGFRPGFIPMKVLQQRYGKAVQGDVLKSVINSTTGEVIRERKMRPALTPQINIEEYKDGGDLVYTMEFESFPDVPEIDFSSITIERSIFEIDDEEMNEAGVRIAERSPKFKEVKSGSKAEKGNIVQIDFKGSIDGKLFDGGSASDFRLELGSGQFIEGFEEQLIGAKVGDEIDVKVTFPKDYGSANLSGKPANFVVNVKEIFSKEIPEVNEEFAKDNGFENLQKLNEAIKSQILKEYDHLVRGQIKKQLFDIFDFDYEFAVPQGMIDLEFNNIWQRVLEAKKQGDTSFEGKSDDELKQEYQDIAKRRVKLGIMLAEIANRNKIQVTREELNRGVMQQASQFPGQERQVFEFYQKNPERIEDLRGPILEEKAVDFVLSKVAYSDKKVSTKELITQAEEDSEIHKKPEKSKEKPAKKKKSS